MQPTNKLRFVNRRYRNYSTTTITPVLQQWWAPTIDLGWGTVETGQGEWRDVPTEEGIEDEPNKD